MMNSTLIDIHVKLKPEAEKPKCRVCLQCEAQIQDNVSSIYAKRNGHFVYEMINYIANIAIKPEDGFTDKICADCTLELENAIRFKQKCEVSNRILLASSRFTAAQNEQEETRYFRAQLLEHTELLMKDADENRIALKEYNNLKQEIEVNNCGEYPTDDYVKDFLVPRDFTIQQNSIASKRVRKIDLKLICNDCGDLFRTKCKLRVHWKKVHQPKTLICDRCKMQFKTYKALHTHRKRKLQSCSTAGKIRIEGEGRTRRFYCKDCDYATYRIRDMTNHLNIHTGERPWACNLCSKTFTQQSVLQSHSETFHNNYLVEITCHLCGKHCKGRSAIYRHMLRHQKSTYECDICGIILTRRNSLLLHLKRHSDKSYFCEKCPSSFYTSHELYSHKLRVHDKAIKSVRKRYHCNLCAYNTSHNKVLLKHRSKHTDNNVSCGKCGKFFENEEKLDLHKKQHFERYHECRQCKNTYYTKEQLRIHVRRRHKGNLDSNEYSNLHLVKKEHDNYFGINGTVGELSSVMQS